MNIFEMQLVPKSQKDGGGIFKGIRYVRRKSSLSVILIVNSKYRSLNLYLNLKPDTDEIKFAYCISDT